jgi:HPt (histidine-containing phosphotransfer) domain-containing protein
LKRNRYLKVQMKTEIEKYIEANLEIDDAETIAMLIASYGESLNENCANIEAAVAAGDNQRAATAAHALKGASANIGAQAIYEVARDLEKLFRDGGAEAQHLLQQLAELREQFISEAAS